MSRVLRLLGIASFFGFMAGTAAALSHAGLLRATILASIGAALAALITSYASHRHRQPLRPISDEGLEIIRLDSLKLLAIRRTISLPTNIYRRGKALDTWHLCSNCSTWPTDNFEETRKPPTGELCNECTAKIDAGTCR